MSKTAVILAGGKGTRLKPYTISIPKPLVPVGEKPVMEIILIKLKENGFEKIIIAVNHMAELIQAYFGNGSKWGLKIIYSVEEIPLSTMGPLKLIDNLPDDFLVMNGDVLTDLDINQFFKNHTDNKNILTIAAHKRTEKIDYGVLGTDGNNFLIEFNEKPEYSFLVSMGIYCLNRKTLDYIPSNEFFGFDHLMNSLIKSNEKPLVYEYDGYWLDIGRPSDYETAINDFNILKK